MSTPPATSATPNISRCSRAKPPRAGSENTIQKAWRFSTPWKATMADIPRYPGRDANGDAKTGADHFMLCPVCRTWFDMRDLEQVFDHTHDASEIHFSEISRPTPRRPVQ